MACIFLSYRRDDSADVVGRIRERLVAKYGKEDVFVDVDAIPVGVNFRDHIDEQVKQCDVFIAAIGSDWLDAKDRKGKRRLDSYEDFVRLEVAAALNRQIPIIPVLVRGADMPAADDLPEELKPLTLQNGLPVRPDPDFNNDMTRLISGIHEHLAGDAGTLEFVRPVTQASVEDERLINDLRRLRLQPEIGSLPFVFDCLAHDSDDVRRRAAQIVQKIGWSTINLQMDRVVKSSAAADIDGLLNGLAAVEATPDTVALLARLCDLLSHDHRTRAFSLTRKKRLAMKLSRVARLFEERHPSYDIVKVLGQGLFTASYLARHRQTDDPAVVRVLLDEYIDRDDIRTQSLELWKRSTRYVHESLVLTRDVSQYPDERIYFCVRDYIDGEPLQHAMHAKRSFDDRFVMTILRNITSALGPIHARGEVHGGIKPSNIFLVNSESARLGDTSLSVTLVRPTDDRLVLDCAYASPESFDASRKLAPQSDYYSLGCVAYELLSGAPPFTSDSEFTLAHLHQTADVPIVLRDGVPLSHVAQGAIEGLLSKRPEDRPASPRDALELLDGLAESLGSVKHEVSLPAASAPPPVPRAVRADMTLISMPPESELDVDRTIFPRYVETSPESEAAPKSASEITPAELKPGDVVKDRFVLEELIGRGGMGTVFKARDLRREEARDRSPFVALKVLNEEFKRHPDSLIALQREARKAQDLAHPNIVTVFDFDRDGSTVFMSMELLEGTSLEKFINNQAGGAVDPREAMKIIQGMGYALEYAHTKGIVHSDFKPSNCYLTTDGVLKVFDFGIARAAKIQGDLDTEKTNFDATTLGALTPAYASPEMMQGKTPDPRDDIYAFACIAYELLAGKHPYDRISAVDAISKSLRPGPIRNVSSRVNRAILNGLSLDRDRRSNSVSEILVSTHPSSKRRWILGAVAVAVAAVVGIALLISQSLHTARIEQILREVEAQNYQQTVQALEMADTLSPDDRSYVLDTARTSIISTFAQQADSLFDAASERYQYPQARAVIEQLSEIYPDSAMVAEIHSELEADRSLLLTQLQERYLENREDGRLLPAEGDDVTDVRAIVAQVDPANPLLTDPRLAQALGDRARAALDAHDLDLAAEYLTFALELDPGNTEFGELQNRLAELRQPPP